MRLVGVGLLLLSGVTLLGQGPPPPPPPPTRDRAPVASGVGSVRGRVVSMETGDPIRNAAVTLGSGDDALGPILTDGAGAFEFLDVPAGAQDITASKTGYARTSFGQKRGFGRGTPVSVTPGAKVENVVVRMPRGGAIAGRVADDRGEPFALASITIERVIRADGRSDTVMVAASDTDDLGEFRFGDLAAGQYVVSLRSFIRSFPPQPFDVEGHTTWLATYYPGVPGLAQAQPVTVRAGQDTSGIDFAAVPARPGRVTISLQDAQGNPAQGLVSAGSESGISGIGNVIVQSTDGRSTELQLDPGNWTIVGRGPKGVGMTRVSVGGDSTPVVVTVAPQGRITARVVADNGEALPSSAVQLTAFPLDDSLRRTSAGIVAGRWLPNGPIVLEGLLGPREFRVTGLATGRSLKAILTADGRDLADQPFEVLPGTSLDVRVVLTNRAAALSGDVVDAQKSPVMDYSVLLYPEDRAHAGNLRRWARWLRADQSGRFSVTDLPPGTYLAVAVDDVDDAQWRNAEYLDEYRSRATRVALGDGDNRTLTLVMETP